MTLIYQFTGTKEQRVEFLLLAKKSGYKSYTMFDDGCLKGAEYSWIIIYPEIKTISGNGLKHNDNFYKTITFKEAMEMVTGKKEEVQVNTINEQVCRTLLSLAKGNGWSGSMYSDVNYPSKYFILYLKPNEKRIDGYSSLDPLCGTISIEEAVELFTSSHTMPFQISGSAVCVYKDKVVVGCTTVFKDEVEQIHQAMQKLNE